MNITQQIEACFKTDKSDEIQMCRLGKACRLKDTYGLKLPRLKNTYDYYPYSKKQMFQALLGQARNGLKTAVQI